MFLSLQYHNLQRETGLIFIPYIFWNIFYCVLFWYIAFNFKTENYGRYMVFTVWMGQGMMKERFFDFVSRKKGGNETSWEWYWTNGKFTEF